MDLIMLYDSDFLMEMCAWCQLQSDHASWHTNDLSTALKFNMEPENGPLEKEVPSGKYHCQVLC